MDVGELRGLIQDLSDDTPILGLDPNGGGPTEDVDIEVGPARFSNGMEMDPAVKITIG